MIPLTLDEVEALCPGRLERAGWSDEATGVQIDSRRVEEGDLFVGVGSGVDYRKHAFARGAAAVLVPDDAFVALGALGQSVRNRSDARVTGITGSTGKTSTKDILAALCAPHARTVAAEASFNNELGVPLTLCRLEADTEICVLELAMRGRGQIARLCELARPDVGVITGIGPVHLELVGTVAGVAEAKAELIAALPAGGLAVVPAGATELEPLLVRDDIELIRFGEGGDVTLVSFEPRGEGAVLDVELRGERVSLEFNFSARFHAQNALAALGAYTALGLPAAEAGRGSAAVAFSRWRGEEAPLPGGGLLINDAYNANPVAMEAALAHLAERAGTRPRVAVLGDMAELGSEAPRYHVEVGAAVASHGVHRLLAVGPLAQGYLEGAAGGMVEARWAATLEQALAMLDEVVEPGDCVLVKGSRAMGLEAIAETLAAVTA